MLFSEAFGIKNVENENWFDPILDLDVALFIDPLLIKRSRLHDFFGSSKKMNIFFQDIFELITKSGGNYNSIYAKRAISLLNFPEVQELCLGYSIESTKGTGPGRTFAIKLYNAIRTYIAFNLAFEDFRIDFLNIFIKGIGHDRISDITGNILKENLIKYTQRICKKYHIKCKKLPIKNINYNSKSHSWEDGHEYLPQNPINGLPILLVPKNFLRHSPILDDISFVEYLENNESEEIRRQLSDEITGNIDKAKIENYIRKNPKLFIQFIESVEKDKSITNYDVDKDEFFLYKWYEIVSSAKSVIENAFLNFSITSENDIIKFVEKLCNDFKLWVENRGGYKLFWNEFDNPVPESNVQKAFDLCSFGICHRFDIDSTPEANGVDFKFSKGTKKVHLEIKLARSSKFFSNLQNQLPQYMKADMGVKTGFYVSVVYKKDEFKKIENAIKLAEKLRKNNIDIRIIVIDASLNKVPASKI